ncbi:hypothetical protein Tdes44962_MAKER06860 [Teratosphaeria destructans]|uniref:Uncharacterized protein n=1 Tax=Teratosphaeria destructans TaxID=418781 RepID=A0A9W7T151_9PEZI|nr:hypothetical protein Tdes44962_MAKER06860 [Teratosphaeria destructans]
MAKRIASARSFSATSSCPAAGIQQTFTSSGGVGLKHNGGSGIPIVSMTFHAPVVGRLGARHQYQSREASSWSGLTEPVVLIGGVVDDEFPDELQAAFVRSGE